MIINKVSIYIINYEKKIIIHLNNYFFIMIAILFFLDNIIDIVNNLFLFVHKITFVNKKVSFIFVLNFNNKFNIFYYP